MSDLADLTDALETLENTLSLLDADELIRALEDHSVALDRHSSILEKMHEADQKERAAKAAMYRLGPM